MSASWMDAMFTGDGFMPHGMCYLWRPDILALHVGSDGLIALAYFSIPFTLLHFVRKRIDLEFTWVFLCFAVFIIACGATHLMEIWTIWHPTYWISGWLKALTALASVGTSVMLIRLLPMALRMPGASALRRLNETLESRVADRTIELEDLNRTLQEDRARFELAADAAGLGFWAFECSGARLHWDDRTYRLFGRSPSDPAQPCDLWARGVHPADHDRCRRELAAALDNDSPYASEFRIVHPSGDVRHLRATARIIRDAGGHPVRMLGVHIDITELKRADEQFRMAMEAAPTGMLLMDPSGAVVLVNAQIERLFGYSRQELLGRSIEMLVPERYRAAHPESRRDFFDAPGARTMGAGRDLYGLRKNGSEVPIEIGLNPIRTSGGEYVLSSIIDLTQRREIDRMRSEFVSTVSHELRTPLTSISGALGLLNSGTMGVLPEKALGMIRIAYKNSERLARIVNDILDIGRLEAGKVVLRMLRVRLEPLLRQAAEANSAYADRFGVRIVFDAAHADRQVTVDPDRFLQVLANLLSNAAKFSPAGADVLLRVRSGGATVRVEVEDSGPGIPEAFKQSLFENFAQADASASRRFDGAGLGLSIARKLTEAMGGTLGFHDAPEQGSVFFVELPLPDDSRSEPDDESGGSVADDRAPALLYVEDDEDLISIMRESLGGDARLVPAHGLREAEQRLRGDRFDLVVLDPQLPDGNGTSLIDRIPSLAGRKLPVVILSSAEVTADIRQKVSVALLKSQSSAAQVATAVLSCLKSSRGPAGSSG